MLAVVGGIDSDDHIAAATALADATGGRTAWIDGTAHYPNLESPAEFTGHLRTVLAG